jgi:heat shock protein HslJ
VKGAHRANVAQMGIYNPVNPASIYTVHPNGVFSCLFYFSLVYNAAYINTRRKNMNFKSILAGVCTLALVACGDTSQNPDVLKGANFVSAQPGVDITLSFDPNEMRVYGRVVNLYNGGYSAEDDNIKFEGFASTMMMGEPEAMAVEQEYFQFMPTVETYEYADGKLTLIGNDGKEIVFVQVETLPESENGTAPSSETVSE